jgi:cystathionine gamma-synthase
MGPCRQGVLLSLSQRFELLRRVPPIGIGRGGERRTLASRGSRGGRDNSESSSLPLTPSQAGERAAALAADRSRQHHPHVDSRLAHAGVGAASHHPASNLPLSPPLHLASTYTRPADGIFRPTDAIYSRQHNPTRLLLEQEVARLEGHGLFDDKGDNAAAAATASQPQSSAWSSGMMAATGLVLAHETPLTVLLPLDLYHGVSSMLQDVLVRFGGVHVHRVDFRHLEEIDLTGVVPANHGVLVWMETPSNPLCHVLDIQAVAAWAREKFETPNGQSLTMVVDSTLAPVPLVQQPLAYDVDVVMHSATKYLAGHSDALIGVLTTNPSTKQGRFLAPRLAEVQTGTGGVASTLDAWLTLRGLRTLAVRVRQQCQTAQRVAEFLEDAKIDVHYPGLPSHPHHAIARRQMKEGMYGGVLSIDLGTEVRGVALAGALQHIHRATSLGGTETLIEHRASIEPEGRVTSPPGLLRLSVGLEDANDLIQDLEQALAIVVEVCGEVVTE